MLARESRVLRSSQLAAANALTGGGGGSSVARHALVPPRTAPRSTAKTIRSGGAAVRAQRVVEYIDPDEAEEEEEKLLQQQAQAQAQALALKQKEQEETERDKENQNPTPVTTSTIPSKRPLGAATPASDRLAPASYQSVGHDSDLDSPGVGRGMALPSTQHGHDSRDRDRDRDSLERMLGLDQEDGLALLDDDEYAPSRLPRSPLAYARGGSAAPSASLGKLGKAASLSPQAEAQHVRDGLSLQSSLRAGVRLQTPPPPPRAASHANERSGSNLPGYELGAGEMDEEEVEEHYLQHQQQQHQQQRNGHGSQAAPLRSEAHPTYFGNNHRRGPSSNAATAPTSHSNSGSDEYADPYAAGSSSTGARAASAAAVLRKSSAERVAAASSAPPTRRAPGEPFPPNHQRVVSQPVPAGASIRPPPPPPVHLSNGHALHQQQQHAPEMAAPTVAAVAHDNEHGKMSLYEQNMQQEAIRQRDLPKARIAGWLGGKVHDGNFRDLKTTTVSLLRQDRM